MRTDRPYRKALAYESRSAELVCNSGTPFDPNLVDMLLEVVQADAWPQRGPRAGAAAPAAKPAAASSAATG